MRTFTPPQSVTVTAEKLRGFFYGVQTLLQLLPAEIFSSNDQGWRIEIKRYPKLTEVGAWRVDREDKPWGERQARKEGEKATCGGVYTQKDIKDVIDYARSLPDGETTIDRSSGSGISLTFKRPGK